MCLDLFSEDTPCGLILVSDHSVLAFWVAAYGKFDCMRLNWIFFINLQRGREFKPAKIPSVEVVWIFI